MFFEQADGYVVVQRVIPTLQAHEVGVRAGWVVRSIDRGGERINLVGMSRDEIIAAIEADPHGAAARRFTQLVMMGAAEYAA